MADDDWDYSTDTSETSQSGSVILPKDFDYGNSPWSSIPDMSSPQSMSNFDDDGDGDNEGDDDDDSDCEILDQSDDSDDDDDDDDAEDADERVVYGPRHCCVVVVCPCLDGIFS